MVSRSFCCLRHWCIELHSLIAAAPALDVEKSVLVFVPARCRGRISKIPERFINPELVHRTVFDPPCRQQIPLPLTVPECFYGLN